LIESSFASFWGFLRHQALWVDEEHFLLHASDSVGDLNELICPKNRGFHHGDIMISMGDLQDPKMEVR
jgi:hypothetical protein